ncbi:MAG: AAA domain-containing protein [Xanthomonadales bacterium]|nr:AAA domain-containing protein [Xanthomonadales bacterium]
MSTLDSVRKLQARMGESIIGQETVIEQLVIGLLANGNILMEGLPGLAKTRAVKSLAKNMDADFSRIQFTPDLLPSDITGSEVLYTEAGQPTFRFEAGPIFANIVLADEINRAPAKVQAALLEAMEERQVTVAGTTHKMPQLFIVMATQNPIEQEGTYPLPEAQMDRFLLHVYIDYGTEEAEAKVIRLVRGEEGSSGAGDSAAPVIQQVVFDARKEINKVQVSDVIEKYIVDLIFATRYPQRYDEKLASWIRIGASPRGAIGLDKCARVHAWLNQRDHVLPDDIRAVVHAVLRHRSALSYEANADGVSTSDVIDEILKVVAVA